MLYTHRVLEGRDLYLIINNSPESATVAPTLRVAGPYDVYRPLTGHVSAGREPLALDLGGYEGVFVVAGAGS